MPHHLRTSDAAPSSILTPDQRLRVFVSSTIRELAAERAAAQASIEAMQLVPVLFELGARPHPPEALYRAYLEQSQIFVGIYWQSYGWVAPGAEISGIEDEYRLSGKRPRLLYVKEPAPDREPRLDVMLEQVAADASYRRFETAAELSELVRRDLAVLITERFGASGAGPPVVSALPSPPTSFVGREAELATIERLIVDDRARLLTLTGAGGIGKTRLAIRAAGQLAPHFRDGAVFVPLEGARDAAAVQTAVATALGARDLGGDPVAGLCAALHGRRLLLVLDNFEQVIDAAPLVATLLESNPELVVLVTSRELLRLRGEHELQVPPLPPEEEAVALFVERAAAARHAFELADEDVPLIAEICRRLDGVPLAIEIAAPRLRLMSVAQLLEALNRRLELAGPRDAPERQRTLEAAIGWSYELLGDEERDAFDRLGVFRASFTLEGATAVCGAGAIDLLGSLLDKSIVYRLPGPGETRFAMLTMIREYAVRRLARTNRLDEAMERLFRFHLGLASDAEPALRSPEQREWTRRLDLEADNIRATLEWLVEHGRSADAAALLGHLWLYWWRGGYIEEFRSWIGRTLTDEERIPSAERGWLLGLDGLLAFMQGDDYPLAVARLQSARPLLAESGNEFGLAMTGGIASVITAAAGDYESAREQIAASLRQFEELGDDWGIALVSSTETWLQGMTGHYDETDEALDRALAAAERAGDDLIVAMVLCNVTARRLLEGDVEAARRTIRTAIDLIQGQGIVYIRPDLLESLSLLAVLEDLPELAAERLGAASALREAMRVPLWGAAAEHVELRLASLREELGDERFEAALARGREARFEEISAAPEALRRRTRGRARSRA